MPSSTPADRQPARNDPQAKSRFLEFLNLSLSCVTGSAVWIVLPRASQEGAWTAVTVPEVLCLEREQEDPIYLRSTIGFVYGDHPRFEGERKVSTTDYAHTVGASESLKPRFYSWEWADTEPRYPHVHVHASSEDDPSVRKRHIPTGRVFFEHVLFFLIQDHGVRCNRDDWLDVLGGSFRRVSEYSSWGGGAGTDLSS